VLVLFWFWKKKPKTQEECLCEYLKGEVSRYKKCQHLSDADIADVVRIMRERIRDGILVLEALYEPIYFRDELYRIRLEMQAKHWKGAVDLDEISA